MPKYKKYEVSEEDFAILNTSDEWRILGKRLIAFADEVQRAALEKYKTYVLIEYTNNGNTIIDEGANFRELFEKAKEILVSRYGEEGLFINTQQLWHSKSPYSHMGFVDFMVGSKEAMTEGRS